MLKKMFQKEIDKIKDDVGYVTKLTIWVLLNPNKALLVIEKAVIEAEVQRFVRKTNQEEVKKRIDN